MKYIKSYNESFDDVFLPLLTVGLIYGYSFVKSFIELKKFEMVKKGLEDILQKIEKDEELEVLFDKLADLMEDNLIESDEFSKLSIDIKNKLKIYLTDEEYNRWDTFSNKYFAKMIFRKSPIDFSKPHTYYNSNNYNNFDS